ncbi:MAG TPA: SGNH/GDSL hydrolase family protein [Gemmatimonadaceae bacterium]|nr:SGNH/GDSL hydrolase family protein [Gemmatimonadaceae bacterium]
MSQNVTRRDFVTAVGAMTASALLPAAASAEPRPAPPPHGTVVLFQGDSITDWYRDRAVHEPNVGTALGTSYALLVASPALAAHPDRDLQFYNRGVSGDKVPDLQARWTTDTLDLAPDVLSVLVGVNDFWHKLLKGYTGTVQDYENEYVALLEATRRAVPHVRLVVLEPFVLRYGHVDARWFPEFDERRAAAARVARHTGATFVPLQRVFDKLSQHPGPHYWSIDGVHPTPAGHAVIAEQWRHAVGI